jgi:predicted metal-dependent phosphotriesterase family hydrolase
MPDITPAPEGGSEATPEMTPAKEPSAPRTDMTVGEMREWLRNWVANATGQSADSIDESVPMVELGLSSRDAVAMASDIEDLTGVTLTATVAFRHPTIEALATVIVEGEPELEVSDDDDDWTRTRDIDEGIAGTGVKAAILKCATDEPGVTPGVERVLRAVAQAHRATGVPITTHTHAHTRRGLDQQRIFAEEGVDLHRVIIGHSGDTTDLDYLEELVAAGSYLGMDRFGLDNILSFSDRVGTVASMCERGHADKMVLAHDAACFMDWLPEAALPVVLPNWHYLHIHNDVLPALRARGVTEEQITTMLVDNPRAIFSHGGAYR